MSDTFTAAISIALVDNLVSLSGVKHFVVDNGSGDLNFGQYSNKLYGLSGYYAADVEDESDQYCGDCDRMPSKVSKRIDSCSLCKKDYRTPNNLMKTHLDELIKTMKSREQRDTNFIFRSIMRDEYLLTSDLNKVLINKDIYLWVPHRFTPLFNLNMMCCFKCCESKLTSPTVEEMKKRRKRKKRRLTISSGGGSRRVKPGVKTQTPKAQQGSHQAREENQLSLSTKALIRNRVTGIDMMSRFGSIFEMSGTFTFLERSWLIEILKKIHNERDLLLIDLEKVDKKRLEKELHQVIVE